MILAGQFFCHCYGRLVGGGGGGGGFFLACEDFGRMLAIHSPLAVVVVVVCFCCCFLSGD